ncbi:MAG: leucine-rich repeat protein [Prevotella sp.]|nr:leucine-rich repeat protein [Prevotella sp.]
MLKKFLTTIIVLAATATAWADGWSVTYDTNNCHDATITKSADGTMTLADAIAEVNSKTKEEYGNLVYVQKVIIVAESMTEEEVTALGAITQNHVDLSSAKGVDDFASLMNNENVKYVILPDGMTKEQVNAVGSGFDAAVSMGAHTKTVWRYSTYNTTGIEYTGVRYNETVVDGTAQATGKVSETVSISNFTTLYSGKVFYDKSGNAYQTSDSDDSKSVQLTAYTERYTYNDNGTTRLYPNSSGYYVVSENGGYVGVQTSSTVTVEKKDVEYTYEKDGQTYVYTFNGYNNPIGKKGEQLYMVEGAQAYDIQKETKWIIESTSAVYNEENGRLVTNNNIGHVDGTTIPLTKVSAYYVPNTNNIYEGPIRIDGEKAYGRDGGNSIELSLSYYYKDWNDNKEKLADKETFYVNYHGTKVATGDGFSEVTLNANGQYVDVNGNIQWGLTEEGIYRKLSDDGKMYVNWYVSPYDVTRFGYEYPDGTTCTEVYTKDGKYYGYTDGTEIELENRISYTTVGGETYDGDVYTYNNEYFGYDGGESVKLKEETSEYYYPNNWIHESNKTIITENDYKSEDGKKVYVGGTQTPLTPYNKEAYVITASNVSGYSQNTIFTGRVYNETTGLIDGTETSVTYSAEGYYYNTDYVYTGEYVTKKANDNDSVYGCTDNSVLSPLVAVYQYTYTDPINGETVVYQTMEQESSVTVQHDVTVTAYEESAGNVHLTAYVSAPGSLKFALARWKDLGNNNAYAAQVGNVTALTLSGDVNYADIGTTGNTITEYGHVAYTDNGNSVTPEGQGHARNIQNDAPAMDGNALTYLDLENAVFTVQTDMQFAKVSEKLVTVKLPTHESMFLIPDNAFNNLQQISELCIPYNYTTIGSCAFHNTHSLMHIYTTDNPEDDSDDETIVDNGPYTYTFSANLKEIEGGIGVKSTFFGDNIEAVTDIYVLAEKAPLCGANAFAGSMTYGNNGFAGNWTHPICRENYINSNKWICVLHYPSSSTDEEAAKYTDITRNYTLIDEVGNVDGDGRPIAWPRHAEFYRAYNQAINGYIWYDWKEYDEGATEVIQIYDASKVSANPTKYDQAYQGWHEFVLVGNSRSRDFDPQKENSDYIQRDWYTICVPYDLTRSQLLNMLGVVNSEAEETVYALKENEGKWEVSETGTAVTQNLYPDVRALTHVSRDINENGAYVSGKVTLHLSEPLISVDENGNVTCSHVDINEDGQGYTHATLEGDDPIVMEGGHAYLIRPYVPKEWNDQIKNLGMYIMAMADSYNNAAVSAGLPAPYSYNEDCKFENKVYLPCFKHKTHAVKGNGSPNASARNIPDFVYEDAEGQSPAYYRFVGTYTQTTVPQYAYYLGKNKTTGAHQFFRTTKETTKWNPYSAVIVGLSSNPNYTGVDTEGQTGIQSVRFVSDSENDLRALAGEVKNPSNAGKSLSFEQLMGDANGEATGIVDVNVNSNVNVSNNKVYSINGQYMGTSLNKLPKGIYIINGQKKVVK